MAPEELAKVERGEKFKISPETRARHHDLLVEGINERVGYFDTLWVVGDVGRWEDMEELFSRLEVKAVNLVRGNHDSPHVEEYFERVFDLFEFHHHGHWLVLCHYPMKSWHRSHWGSVQLHGHDHSRDVSLPHEFQVNLCVDLNGFRPLSFEDVVAKVEAKRPAFEEWRRKFREKDAGRMKNGD